MLSFHNPCLTNDHEAWGSPTIDPALASTVADRLITLASDPMSRLLRRDPDWPTNMLWIAQGPKEHARNRSALTPNHPGFCDQDQPFVASGVVGNRGFGL